MALMTGMAASTTAARQHPASDPGAQPFLSSMMLVWGVKEIQGWGFSVCQPQWCNCICHEPEREAWLLRSKSFRPFQNHHVRRWQGLTNMPTF